MISRPSFGLLLGFIGMVGFAGTLPANRIAVVSLDPWFITVARAAIAGVLAVALLLATKRRIPTRAHWTALAIASLCLVIGFPLFSALAMQTVPAAHGGVVLGILPLVTAAAATAIAGERPSAGFWIAAACGAALVVAFAMREGAGTFVIGDAWLAAAIASAGIGYTYSGKLARSMPGWEVIAWLLAPALPLSVIATAALWPASAAAVPSDAWLALLYVALISQFVAFFFWNAGLAMGGIARVGQVQLLQPFVIVALAVVINREAVTTETLAFAAAVIATVFIGARMRVGKQ
jgi:drug/metabolite transporter (DMT)-like permease